MRSISEFGNGWQLLQSWDSWVTCGASVQKTHSLGFRESWEVRERRNWLLEVASTEVVLQDATRATREKERRLSFSRLPILVKLSSLISSLHKDITCKSQGPSIQSERGNIDSGAEIQEIGDVQRWSALLGKPSRGTSHNSFICDLMVHAEQHWQAGLLPSLPHDDP